MFFWGLMVFVISENVIELIVWEIVNIILCIYREVILDIGVIVKVEFVYYIVWGFEVFIRIFGGDLVGSGMVFGDWLVLCLFSIFEFEFEVDFVWSFGVDVVEELNVVDVVER